MMHVLDIHSVRDLEDLIIDAIYRNVIKARLDQRNKLIVVEYTMGRDIRPDSVSQVADQLHKW